MSDEQPEIAQSTDERAAKAPMRAGLPISASRTVDSRGATPHSDKFRIATATLVGIALGALAIAAVIVTHHSSSSSTAPWSAWSPTDQGKLGATEIADHLAPLYRISATDQLDVVTLLNLDNPSAAGTTSGSGLEVAVNTGSAASTTSTEDLSLLTGKTMAYDLCGIGGSNCSIPGTPSSNRLLLLRREALELALYTLKYLHGIDNVVAILPPGHTETTSQLTSKPPASGSSSTQPVTVAVLFTRSELSPWLNEPLDETLTAFPPDVAQLGEWRDTEEAGLVDQITARGLFSEQIESQQDGANLLVLNPLPPQ